MSASNSAKAPVLVVGAGPGGLIAALALAQHGVPVRVIEKLPAFHTASRGAGTQPRSLEIYNFLGLWPDIRKELMSVPPFVSYKLPGGTEVERTWSLWEAVEPTPDRPFINNVGSGISQYVIEGLMRKHLAKYSVEPELSAELVSFVQDSDGVTATIKHAGGTDHETTETFRASYIIGSDGARGPTRRLIGALFEGQTKDLDGQIWADAEVEGLAADKWHLWSDKNVSVSARNTEREGQFHIGLVGIGFDPIEYLDKDKFVAFIHEHTGRKDLKITNFTSLSYWKPKMRMVSRFYNGRAFILGDAAHVHSPTGGQGLNTTIQDSFNLAWKMALVHKGLAKPELLSTFEAERLPVVALMLATTSGLYANIVADKVREEKEKEENTSGFFKWRNQALFHLDINYRWSPLVLDARGNGDDLDALKARAYIGYQGEDLHAGDRAPEAPKLVDASGKESSLFEIFKPTLHTVLVFSPELDHTDGHVDAVLDLVKELPEGTCQTVVIARNGLPKTRSGAAVYHDKEGYAFRTYGVPEGKVTVAAVRPDDYVGAFVFDANSLKLYFSKIFV
ncbi:FAD binding domain-containing protein [Lenzites betulinus]|nr:FAD binding domain-containing protein [Lenzites betulinus]